MRLAAWLAAGAPVALGCMTAGWLLLAAAGRHPMWPIEPMNLGEAVALRDAGEVARLVAAGHDPDGRYRLRGSLLGGRSLTLTPLEAAAAAGRPEIAELLRDLGATR